jgi:hypothetical protein
LLLAQYLLPIGIQRQDIGMIQSSDGFGLPLEEAARLFSALALRVDNALTSDPNGVLPEAYTPPL